MTVARDGWPTAVVLGSGKVLIAGGLEGATTTTYVALSSAELYDPAAGTFAATGSMATARFWNTATLLGSGEVLVAGGALSLSATTSAVELYDPVAGTFASTAAMDAARQEFTATPLASGEVLVAGGQPTGPVPPSSRAPSSSAAPPRARPAPTAEPSPHATAPR